MNAIQTLIAACSVFACAAALAETYEGVHPLTHERDRASVQSEAVAAMREPNPYEEGADSRGPRPMLASADRREIEREAIATAHAPNQNLWSEAFVNSVVPEQFNNSAVNTRFSAGDPSQGEPRS